MCDFLDNDQEGGKVKKERFDNHNSAKAVLDSSIQYEKFVIILSFDSVQDEGKIFDMIEYFFSIYLPKIHSSYKTDIEHVYVIAFDNDGSLDLKSLDKKYNYLVSAIQDTIGNGSMHIETYYDNEIYPTSGEIKAKRKVLDIHVNKDNPLDMNFIYTLTNRYTEDGDYTTVKVDNTKLHIK